LGGRSSLHSWPFSPDLPGDIRCFPRVARLPRQRSRRPRRGCATGSPAGLVPAIQPTTCSGVCLAVDRGYKCRDDRSRLWRLGGPFKSMPNAGYVIRSPQGLSRPRRGLLHDVKERGGGRRSHGESDEAKCSRAGLGRENWGRPGPLPALTRSERRRQRRRPQDRCSTGARSIAELQWGADGWRRIARPARIAREAMCYHI
jgi:hypothetical protein